MPLSLHPGASILALFRVNCGESPMKKISSGKNHEYEMRFRQEEDSYMQYVQSARPMFESELFT